MQHWLGRHRAMFLDPRVEPLPGYAFRDINEMVGLASEVKNLGHIDVIKSLGATRFLLELLPHRWIDAFDRDEFQGNGFVGSFVDSLVSNNRTGRTKFARGAVAVNTDPIVLEESCALHKRLVRRGERITIGPPRYHSTSILAVSCSRNAGYPAWIRTKNNASKGRCVTVTPRGIGISAFSIGEFVVQRNWQYYFRHHSIRDQ